MKKYYYDCAIQALYMHLNFNVRCLTEVKLIANLNEDNVCENMIPEITKIYVDNESNHIFEPKDYDLINDDTGEIIMRSGKHFFMPKLEM